MKAPDIGEGRRGLEGHLLYLLRQANAAAQQAVNRELTALNLGLAQYTALTMIKAYDGLSNADLSRISMLSPQSTNETVQRLDAAGLITRRRDDEHGRILRLVITDQGRQVLEKAREIGDRVESRLVALAGPEIVELKKWLVDAASELSEGDNVIDRGVSQHST
jgi:DNA-binding MarR family transcriptional regulator